MGQRLLIVDSDRAFLKEHQVALESAFDVDFAHATEGAITRLETGQYAAVLICVEVSENKGYALCSAIRKHPQLATLKVLLISAKATEEEYARHQSLKGRADAYLHKPILSSALLAALSPMVPPKVVDPDNPLGDLTGADIGDEWLESLKVDLEAELQVEVPSEPPKPARSKPELVTVPVAPAPPASSLQTVTFQVPPSLKAAPNQGALELLESRIQDLERKLLNKVEEAKTATSELERVNVLLSETERARDQYRGRLETMEGELANLARYEAEAEELRNTLRLRDEALERRDEHHALLKAELDKLRSESSQRDQELDRLQGEVVRLEQTRKELQEARTHVAEAKKELDAAHQDVGGLEATLRAQRRELAEQNTQINALNREKDALVARNAGLEEGAQRSQQLQQELTDALRRADAAEGARRGLENQQDRLSEALRTSEAALEDATHRLRDAEGKLGYLERDLTESRQRLEDLQQAHGREHQRAEQLEGELHQVREALARAHAEAEDARQRAVAELNAILREREEQLQRLTQVSDGQRERIEALEQEKRSLEGHLAERSARLDSLSTAVADLEQSIRRASDLTRPF